MQREGGCPQDRPVGLDRVGCQGSLGVPRGGVRSWRRVRRCRNEEQVRERVPGPVIVQERRREQHVVLSKEPTCLDMALTNKRTYTLFHLC